MKASKVLRAPSSLLLALCLAACLGGGNSGSETTNGLSGTVLDRDQSPVAGARVLLLDEAHNGARPEGDRKPPETASDAAGRYAFRDIKPGTYNLEISHAASGTRTRVAAIRVAAEAVAVGAAGLEIPGSVEIPVPDFLGGGRPGYIYLPGTTRFERVDSAERAAGVVVIDSVAPGTYPFLSLVVEENSAEPVVLAEDVVVKAGERTVVPPFGSWKHSRRIEVSPVSGGATAPSPVRDFPLLVRLASGSFDFAQAARDGRDVRFTGPGGRALPHEIEHWDSTAGRAELWVRLDSVRWDAPGQYVEMHWGRPGAPAVSSGAAVFAGEAAFATVYHLAEPGNEAAGGYKDATANANHATASGINKTPLLEGVAGMAKSFAGDLGTLSAAVPPGFGGDGSFSVTFWMKPKVQSRRSNILDFGSAQTLRGAHFLIMADTVAQFGGYDSDGNYPLSTADWQNVFKMGPWLDRWTHVALVYDPAARRTVTWFDGKRMAESPMDSAGMQVEAKAGLRIGKALGAGELPYDGVLDEVRFHAATLTESRIRLDYETQKPAAP